MGPRNCPVTVANEDDRKPKEEKNIEGGEYPQGAALIESEKRYVSRFIAFLNEEPCDQEAAQYKENFHAHGAVNALESKVIKDN